MTPGRLGVSCGNACRSQRRIHFSAMGLYARSGPDLDRLLACQILVQYRGAFARKSALELPYSRGSSPSSGRTHPRSFCHLESIKSSRHVLERSVLGFFSGLKFQAVRVKQSIYTALWAC